MMKQIFGSWPSVRKAAEIAPASPPAAWHDQLNVLSIAEPFYGSFRAYITIRESMITSEKAIDRFVKKVQTAARATLL